MFSVLFVSTSRASSPISDASWLTSGGSQLEAAERATGYEVVFVRLVQFAAERVPPDTPGAAPFPPAGGASADPGARRGVARDHPRRLLAERHPRHEVGGAFRKGIRR